MGGHRTDPRLFVRLKEKLAQREAVELHPLAAVSREGRRRRPERDDMRLAFALDVDRILHSRAYTRYIDKTQVFSLVKNDHITHRVLHVQLVSRIGRTVGRFLGLNLDLIEAIALGHDIGHPPFGHDGEQELGRLCAEHGLPVFQHNIQSVRFLDRIERQGCGWNLTLQTLDGILCHDGEVHDQLLAPRRDKDFSRLDQEIVDKAADPGLALYPMTLEGCVVRFADTIGYIGRDIEDAIELGLIRRAEIPADCRDLLGDTNGKIVYTLVTDLVATSMAGSNGRGAGDAVGLSPEVSQGLRALKDFNYQRIYLNPAAKQGLDRIQACYRALFESCLEDLRRERSDSVVFSSFLATLEPDYRDRETPAGVVRDFIAGMTDDYFLAQAARIGCKIPAKREQLF